MSDTQAILSELARVKATFQLLPLSLVLHGEQGFFNPSALQHRETRSPDRLRVADLNGRVSFHDRSLYA